MKKECSKKETHCLSDEEVLSLYHQGYSAKNISQTHGINVARISKILRSFGFAPRDYKTSPDYVKRVLHQLILAGFTYLDISKKTNMAYSFVKEYASQSEELRERSPELFARKVNNASPPIVPLATVCEKEMISDFCTAYVNGTSGFCALMKTLQANDEQAVYLFSIIDEEMLKKHNELLFEVIVAEHKQGIPVIGIGKKLGVSPAIVAKVVKNHHIEN